MPSLVGCLTGSPPGQGLPKWRQISAYPRSTSAAFTFAHWPRKTAANDRGLGVTVVLINERKDAVTQQEGLDEVTPETTGPAVPGDPSTDPATQARHAERDAHTPRDSGGTKGKG